MNRYDSHRAYLLVTIAIIFWSVHLWTLIDYQFHEIHCRIRARDYYPVSLSTSTIAIISASRSPVLVKPTYRFNQRGVSLLPNRMQIGNLLVRLLVLRRLHRYVNLLLVRNSCAADLFIFFFLRERYVRYNEVLRLRLGSYSDVRSIIHSIHERKEQVLEINMPYHLTRKCHCTNA